jgi:hypothetical protein
MKDCGRRFTKTRMLALCCECFARWRSGIFIFEQDFPKIYGANSFLCKFMIAGERKKLGSNVLLDF